MAIIRSGASTSTLTIDPTSKAARVTQYDSAGNEVFPKSEGGSYIAKMEVRCTTALTAASTIMNIRAPADANPLLRMNVRNIRGCVAFDGLSLSGSGTLRIGLYRGIGNVSPTTGTAIAASAITKKDSTMANSTIVDCRYNAAGLTTTGITYETDPIHVFSLPVISLQVAVPTTSASIGPVANFDLDLHTPGSLSSNLVLGPDQHLALRIQTVAAIIGFGIYGSISWTERT